jgi:hypothetical protein
MSRFPVKPTTGTVADYGFREYGTTSRGEFPVHSGDAVAYANRPYGQANKTRLITPHTLYHIDEVRDAKTRPLSGFGAVIPSLPQEDNQREFESSYKAGYSAVRSTSPPIDKNVTAAGVVDEKREKIPLPGPDLSTTQKKSTMRKTVITYGDQDRSRVPGRNTWFG